MPGPSAARSRTFRSRLLEEFGIATPGTLAEIERGIDAQVQEALDFARTSAEPDPATVLAPRLCRADQPARGAAAAAAGDPATSRPAGSTRCATASPRRCAASRNIIYFGEGTGERGGTFAHTKGLWQEFGAERMVDTPISRAGLHRRRARRLGHRAARRSPT